VVYESGPRYITIRAAVRHYGRSRSAIYVRLKHKDFEAIRVNAHVYIRVSSADAFFDAKPQWEPGGGRLG
jgi:hypothetical protein